MFSRFSPASRIILIERKKTRRMGGIKSFSFSPASRIILIESNFGVWISSSDLEFQSRKQDYFNWKRNQPS